jgi:hypothetical protein
MAPLAKNPGESPRVITDTVLTGVQRTAKEQKVHLLTDVFEKTDQNYRMSFYGNNPLRRNMVRSGS